MNIATLEFLEIVSLGLSLAFLVFLPLELYQRWRRGALNRAMFKEMLASSSPILPTLLLFSLVNTLVLTVFLFAQRFAIGAIPVNVWTVLLCLVCIDFLYYIDHRCGHRIRAYWAISHSVHHSSNQYDQTTAFRMSFVDGILSPWFYLPAVNKICRASFPAAPSPACRRSISNPCCSARCDI